MQQTKDEAREETLRRWTALPAEDRLTLEQANVDVTKELMTMLRSQQVYAGNARMLQTDVEITQRMTDKL